MEIKNSTKWSTEDLRKLFRRCAKEVDKVEKPSFPFHERNKHFQLDIKNSSYRGISGRAYLNGYWIGIKIVCSYGSEIKDDEIEKGWQIVRDLNIDEKTQLARLIIHEYYHTIGFKYHDKNNYKHDFTQKWNVDWVKDYPIRKKEIALKPKVDIKLKRYQQAIENLRKAETRLKRAKTLHNKWKIKVKYYQKEYNFN